MNPTSNQKDFYDFCYTYKANHAHFPTFKVIQDHFGYRSPNSVTQHIESLIKKGWILRDSNKELHLRMGIPKSQSVSALLEELRIIALSESIPIPLGARIERIHQEISLLTQWNNMDIILPPEGSVYEVCTVGSGTYWRYYEKP